MKKVSCGEYYEYLYGNVFNGNIETTHSLTYPSDTEELDEYRNNKGKVIARRYEKRTPEGIFFRRHTDFFISK